MTLVNVVFKKDWINKRLILR